MSEILLDDVKRQLLAPCDAARRLGITTSGVIKLALRGVLPELRDSANRRLFLARDVERLVAQRAAHRTNGKKLRPMVRKFLERA